MDDPTLHLCVLEPLQQTLLGRSLESRIHTHSSSKTTSTVTALQMAVIQPSTASFPHQL